MIQPGSLAKPKYLEQSHAFELTGYLLWGVFPEKKNKKEENQFASAVFAAHWKEGLVEVYGCSSAHQAL